MPIQTAINNRSPETKQIQLWEFAPTRNYVLPINYTQSKVHHLWHYLSGLLGKTADPQVPFKRDDELDLLPRERLARLIPLPAWDGAVDALEAQLQHWLAQEATAVPVKIVIGQPYSGCSQIVEQLGERLQCEAMAPPSTVQILGDPQSYFDHWPQPASEKIWVLPHLERCYLRHANGLTLIRRLLDQALSGELGRGLIACDSWAWAYFQQIIPLHDAETLTLQAFDGDRLRHYLTANSSVVSAKPVYCFNARSGSEILGDAETEKNALPIEFVEIAAQSRGNLTIALHYWRTRLRCQPDEALLELDDDDGATSSLGAPDLHTSSDAATLASCAAFGQAGASVQSRPSSAAASKTVASSNASESVNKHDEWRGKRRTVWLGAMPTDPVLPPGDVEEFAILLHTLLLHGGLNESVGDELMPYSAVYIRRLLGLLSQYRIVEKTDERWHVCPGAYAMVRRLLCSRSYLADTF